MTETIDSSYSRAARDEATLAHNGTSALTTEEAAQRDALAERIFQTFVASGDLVAVYIGDRLGLYRALAAIGLATPAVLAKRAGTDERYTREWLEQQAVAGIVEVDDVHVEAPARRYRLPRGHAVALLEWDSPSYMVPLVRMIVGGGQMMPSLLEAFQTGGGVPYSDYNEDLREGQAELARTIYFNQLATAWLPAIPEVHARLQADPPASIADIACGYGWSSIAIAQVYPKVRIDGFDSDSASIAAARTAAAAAGVGDRVTFTVSDATDLPLSNTYDVVTIFNALHEMARPVEALRSLRHLVREGGAVIVAEPRAPEQFTAPGDTFDQLRYVGSLLFCLPTSMAEQPSAGIGQVLRPETLRRYAREASFREVEILPIEDLFFRFYRLIP